MKLGICGHTCGLARPGLPRFGLAARYSRAGRILALAAAVWGPAAFATDFTISISTANSTRNAYGSFALAGSFSSPSDVVNGCVWLNGGGVLQDNASATLIDNIVLSLQSPRTVQPDSIASLKGGWTATFPNAARIGSFLATELQNGDLQVTIVNFSQTLVAQFVISSSLAGQLTYAALADLSGSLFQSLLDEPTPDMVECSPSWSEAMTGAISTCSPNPVSDFSYSCAADGSVSVSFSCGTSS